MAARSAQPQNTARHVIADGLDARGQDHSGQFVVGYTGQVSLGHAGLFGIGAYTAGVMVTKLGTPLLVTLIGAIGVTALFGAARAVVQRVCIAQHPVREHRQRNARGGQFRDNPQGLADFLLGPRHRAADEARAARLPPRTREQAARPSRSRARLVSAGDAIPTRWPSPSGRRPLPGKEECRYRGR